MPNPNMTLRGHTENIHTPAIFDCVPDTSETRASIGLARGPASISAVHKQATPRKDGGSRTGTRNKFIKMRVALDEYASIARQADIASQTLSEYVREQVLAVHCALDLRAELAALRGLVSAPGRSTGDALTLEAVLLLRELAAARDMQILGRVRAQLAQQRGGKA